MVGGMDTPKLNAPGFFKVNAGNADSTRVVTNGFTHAAVGA